VGIGAAVVAALIIAVVMMNGSKNPPAPEPSPAVSADAGATSTPTPTPDAAATPTPTPTTSQAGTAGTAGSAAGAGAVQPTPTATGARGTPTATATPTPTPGAVLPAGTAADAATAFPNVKIYLIANNRATDRDAVLNFGGGQLAIVPKEGGAPLASLTYRRITRGTYVRSRDPKWDPALSSPPAGVDFSSGIGGLLGGGRHWLVLQGADHFEILRLENANFAKILDAIETRVGIKIAR
jgi:hypothetical protein